jgi:predicted metal-dependent phosphoesterase TrpH
LDGVAITDHNAVGGIREAEEAAGTEFVVIPGLEISTKSGHVLAYGIREVVPRDLSVAETVRRIEAIGGVAVAAHPYRFWSGLGEAALSEASFVAYETRNARTLRGGNERARALALARQVGQTSHFLDEVGQAITTLDSGIVRPEDVVELLEARKTSAEGRSRGASATVRYVTKAVGEWIFRGMRRI